MLGDTVVIDVDSHWEPARNPQLPGGDPDARVRNLAGIHGSSMFGCSSSGRWAWASNSTSRRARRGH
jgi:hypothetical protein